jgi:hypothetical protein
MLPPTLPKEYAYSLHQSYKATSIARGKVLNDEEITATQYWSLSKQSTRGMMTSSGIGISKGAPAAAINELSVTNYTDTAKGSLVTDLIGRKCTYYGVEGGSAYTGYDYYRNFIAGALAEGIAVLQYNVTDWGFDGKRYGPVNIFSATPPTPSPDRLLQYTLVFQVSKSFSFGILITYQQLFDPPV